MGICVLDATTAGFSLSYFEDDVSRTQLETLIRQLKPKELIHEKGNLSASTLRLLRNTLSIETQWTALKPKTEFLRPEATKQELRKLFGEAEANKFQGKGKQAMEVDDENDPDRLVPDDIKVMYDKDIAMSALGGMIWYLCFFRSGSSSNWFLLPLVLPKVPVPAQSRFRAVRRSFSVEGFIPPADICVMI